MSLYNSLITVPDGFPSNVQSTSAQLSMITVTWIPPPANLTNGRITGYRVRYTSNSPQYAITTELSATLNIEAGDTYLISIAAQTAVGEGPFSTPEVQQETIQSPVTFPSANPSPPTGDGLTVSTVPFTLPAVAVGAFRWVHAHSMVVLCGKVWFIRRCLSGHNNRI